MNYAAARHNMVEAQVRTNHVTDPRVIEALEAVPRELFVPKQYCGVAYVDGTIALRGGRRLMEPMVFARLLQSAEIRSGDVVLDVGCATGYSAAVLARVATTVVALESDAEMAGRAGTLLASLGVDNVAVVTGNLADGDRAHGPYDVILVEGEVEAIPASLTSQLANGGRLLAVVSAPSGLGHATLVSRFGDVVSSRVIFDAAAGRLPGFAAKAEFVF